MRKRRDANKLSLSEHIRELKCRIVTILTIFLIVFIVAYIKSNELIDLITTLGKNVGYEFIYLAPQEVIIQQIRVSGVTALFFTLPIIVYEIIAFIAPVFSDRSFMRLLFIGFIAIILFILGAMFAYKILLPFVYMFLYEMGQTNGIKAQISIKEYISLFITLEASIGIITEMPLICVMLSKIGILTPKIMIDIRPYIIVIIFIVAAIVTPPDVVSQMIVAIPMILLYQISIIVCNFIKGGNHNGNSRKEHNK